MVYNNDMKKTLCILLMVLMVIPVFAANAKNSFTDLEAYDTKGEVVTSDIFEGKDVTMINIFTTWCYYCILEMPDLRTLYRDLPENANLIMICADAYEAPKDLQDIIDYFKLENPILKMKGSEVQSYYGLTGYPTSLFVDSEGNILKVVVGANSYEGYKKVFDSLLGQDK